MTERRACDPSQLFQRTALCAAALSVTVGLSACSSVSEALSPAKVDYRNGAVRTTTLEVPPDLTQLANDPRYQPPSGTISAAAIQQANPDAGRAGVPGAVVAPTRSGDTRIERSANVRWLVTPLTPEQLWPVLREFWQHNGFTLTTDRPEIGLMETDWAENRTKLPQNFVQRSVGKVLSGLVDSGERDLYRTRIERGPGGTEVYISHRGAIEQYTDTSREQTRWLPRANDPQLEAEMLSLLMAQLTSDNGATPATAARGSALATPTGTPQAATTPARARELRGADGAAALQVDDEFNRAWRRVGAALDRSGFTVEDRDRSLGVYYVRYVDPKLAGKEEPNFFARLFGAKKEDLSGARYQITVKSDGGSSNVSILDSRGVPQSTDAARSIVQLLINELR